MDFESKFTKEGQATAAANSDFQNITTVLDNLQKAMPSPAGATPAAAPGDEADPNALPEISHVGAGKPGSQDPKLTSANLEGLGALASWAAGNAITVDGKRIAFSSNEVQDAPGEDYQLYRLEPNAGLLEVGDRSVVKQGFYINKDLLVKFITWRLAVLSQKPNMVEKVQLGKLIADANRLLGTKISPEYKAPEATLSPNTLIDELPGVIDGNNPMNNGAKQLFFKDIQSDTALNAWLKNAPMTFMKTKDKDVPAYPPSNEFDMCVIVKVLWTRANVWSTRAPSDAEKKKFVVYKRQMEKLAPTITGANGKACQLAGATPQPGAQPNQVNAPAIAQAISTLPFNIRDINFNRIKKFFEVVKPLMENVPNNEAAMAHMTNVEETLIPQAFNLLAVKDGIIPLGERVHQFAGRLSNQQEPGKQVFPLISALDRILDETRAVVEAFWSAYGDKVNSGQQAQILGQIGRNPNDSSIYSRNADALETLRTSGTVT